MFCLLLQLPTQVAARTRMKCHRARNRRRPPRASRTSACATSSSTSLDDARLKLLNKVVFLLFQYLSLSACSSFFTHLRQKFHPVYQSTRAQQFCYSLNFKNLLDTKKIFFHLEKIIGFAQIAIFCKIISKFSQS